MSPKTNEKNRLPDPDRAQDLGSQGYASTFSVSLHSLILGVCIYLTVCFNATLYSRFLQIYPLDQGNFGFFLSLIVVVASLNCALLVLVAWRLSAKPLLIALIITSSVISYFAQTYGIVVNDEVIASLLLTDTREARDLFNIEFLFHVGIFGLLPSIFIGLVRIRHSRWKADAFRRCATLTLCMAAIGIALFSYADRYAIFLREHKEVRYYQLPFYPLYSAIKYARSSEQTTQALKLILKDAYRLADAKPHKLTIVIVGETARADHFSLNGYPRKTNSYTDKVENLYSYSNVTSCATSTAYSLPCMFSIKPRVDFDRREAINSENTLDVLQRLGVNVLWRDNNSDSKGVALRVPYQDFRDREVNPVCDAECRDIGMLSGLPEYISEHEGDKLIVLHQMGNHGPAYYRRYPTDFGAFTPTCNKLELADCTSAEIINSYDNAIQYTDYFIAQTIQLLQKYDDQYDTSMLYIGDHGESLGENGLYLHGLPYAIAPKEQTHVPLLVWFGKHTGIDIHSIERSRSTSFSHDDISFALLDMFDVRSKALIGASRLLTKEGTKGSIADAL